MLTITTLNKSFHRLHVLKDISLTIAPAKVTTIAGPNGVGKSTLIRSILGFVTPDSGDILLSGKSILNDYRYRYNIGYMQQKPEYPENLTVQEILDLATSIRGVTDEPDMELFHEFRFGNETSKKFKELSGGNKQKVNALLAFLFRPSLIILDEPTAGLDPFAALCLKEKIAREKLNGKTIILTTHHSADIEQLTDDIVFLKDGKVVFHSALPDLLDNHHGKNLETIMASYFATILTGENK